MRDNLDGERKENLKKKTKQQNKKKKSDCNWTRTHNHLVHKRTLWLNV